MADKPENPPVFPKGWLKRELDAAVREVANWSPGMRRENERTKQDGK